jgi:F-type H+-transporting ATPase subunit b
LVFIIVKFGKKPLLNFLQIRREETERDIRRAEEKQKTAQAEIQKIQETNKESRLRYQRLKERIVDEGDKRKKEIIEDAKQQSRLMIETAKRKAENRILEAKEKLQLELMDAAIAIAETKLPDVFTAEDDSNWISQLETHMHKSY